MTPFAVPSMVHTITASQQRAGAALLLFNTALAAGQKRSFWAKWTGRATGLRHLDRPATGRQGGSFIGRRTVRIADIRGSEGRTGDFDDQFHPLSSRSRQRWASVARAVEEGVPLPPVELIQAGAEYYVRDGHHRISVAAALGMEMVEATVTQWNGN